MEFTLFILLPIVYIAFIVFVIKIKKIFNSILYLILTTIIYISISLIIAFKEGGEAIMAIGLMIGFFVPFIVAVALIIKVKAYLKMRAQEQASQSVGSSTPIAPGQSGTSIPQQSNIVSINKKSNNKDYFVLATLALMIGSAIAFGSNYLCHRFCPV